MSRYLLTPLRKEDLENIRLWRNAQIDILRQTAPLTCEDQKIYYENIIAPSRAQENPRQVLFSFMKDGQCIGYGGVVHIDWPSQRGELSFLLNPEIKDYNPEFAQFLKLVLKIAFRDLKLHRIFTETFAFRAAHIEVLQKAGFKYEGTLREHNYKKGAFYDSLMHGLLAKDYVDA